MILQCAMEKLQAAQPEFRLRLIWGWVKDKYNPISLKEFQALIEYTNQLKREQR